MAQTSYPFDNADTTEAQYSQLFRRLQSTGVAGDSAGTALKVTGDSSGMQVKVAAGFAIVRGHAYNNDAQAVLAIDAATSNPRRDLICLKLDPTANSITLVVKKGTAASSPVDPTLTQTDEGVYELPLARVLLPANATTVSAGDVTDVRTFTGDQWGRWTTALRPASPRVGEAGFNVTNASAELWDGTAWVEIQPSSILASRLSAAEQANISAGTIRAGGTSSGNATRVFIQSATPTGASAGDLWFW